ncbi:MAG: 6-bladed beta-propeller [Thermodesulfovibrionales bacterium]|nr:6-bladed beta-propeller [Thermodesulfovibrionales bacterium]
MKGKILYLPIVIALSAIIFLSPSEFASAATAPASTPLGYNTLQGCAPARIATDSSGKIYVTDANTESVRVFSNNGVPLSNIRANKPLGLAVDSSGRIFVGSVSEGSVSVFSTDGKLLYQLGSGAGEFVMPSDIAISSSGTVYVTDSMQNKVKSYTAAGAPLSSITGLNFPTGIAVDDAAGEIYVSDHNSSTVKIFGMNGILKRYIKSSVFLRPQGLALDSTRVYILDAYNSTVAVYGKDGIFLKYMGNYGEGAGQFRTPLDVVIDRSNKVFVTNHNNSRIEMIGIDSYSQLNISPNTINLSVFEDGSSIAQTLNLTSTGNAAGWVASSSNSWVTASPSAGTTPSEVNITVSPAGLSAGNYTAQVMFSMSSGTAAVVLVNLEVKPQSKTLYVAPTNINFKYPQESLNYQSINVAFTYSGGSLAWTASSNAAWISPDRASGITPDNIKLSINSAVGALGAGNYNAKVIVDGGSAQGSPASVNVSLTVINAGTVKVTANIKEAGFDITGPVNYAGTGTEWINDEVLPGDYTISFKHVSGYIKPYTRTFTVKTGREVAIDGAYRVKPIATHLIAGAGGAKDAKEEVYTLDGTLTASFEPFKGPANIRVAAGDIEGSGADMIATTDNKKSIKIYTSEGLELASTTMDESYSKCEIAVADINNDGIAEIIAAVRNEYDPANIQREIKRFTYSEGKLTEKETLYKEINDRDYKIAVGDINGDGMNELLIADEKGLRAFSINLTEETKLKALWAADGKYENAEMATGDIDDDGIAEIALGTEQEGKGIIKILKGNGDDYKLQIEPYNDLGYEGAPSVALGDLDKDGADEILAGAGKDEKNEGLIRTYESDGSFTNTTIKTGMSKFGVNIAVGRFK